MQNWLSDGKGDYITIGHWGGAVAHPGGIGNHITILGGGIDIHRNGDHSLGADRDYIKGGGNRLTVAKDLPATASGNRHMRIV